MSVLNNPPAAGTAQGLVRGGGDHVSVVERRGDETGGDQPGDVRHVGEEVPRTRIVDKKHSSRDWIMTDEFILTCGVYRGGGD